MKLKYWLYGIVIGLAYLVLLGSTEATAPAIELVDCSTPLKPGHYRTRTIVADGRVIRRCRYA